MIVDDHAVIRRMIRAVFEAEGWEVSDAANGAEAVEKAELAKPILIILDLSMPVMNGLEAARRLKALVPHVPLLMFTNHPNGMVKKEADSAGIFALVNKSDSDATIQLLAHAKRFRGPRGEPNETLNSPPS